MFYEFILYFLLKYTPSSGQGWRLAGGNLMYETAMGTVFREEFIDEFAQTCTAAQPDNGPPPIVVLAGDGVGPEVTDACIRVLTAVCCDLDFVFEEAGDGAMANGAVVALSDKALASIDRSGIVLKGPLKGPVQGEGCYGDNTLEHAFGLHSAVVFAKEYPGSGWPHSSLGTDLAIVSNIAPTDGVHEKDAAGSETLADVQNSEFGGLSATAAFAFLLAGNPCWKQLHAISDTLKAGTPSYGLQDAVRCLQERFPDVKVQEIQASGFLEKLVSQPHRYDVLLTREALFGAVSRVAAELVGGPSMMAAMRAGPETVVFEPAHGPLVAMEGHNVANPTAMILAGVALLRHLGRNRAAAEIEEALWRVFRNARALPFDMARPGAGVGCRAFADAVVEEISNFPIDRPRWRPARDSKLDVVAA